jgi:hypothetical protein
MPENLCVQISLHWEYTVNRKVRPELIPKNSKFTDFIENIQVEQSVSSDLRGDGTCSQYLSSPF